MRTIVGVILKDLSPLAEGRFHKGRRPRIARERALQTLLFQQLYCVRSELPLMEELDYTLLFSWFEGLIMYGTIWDGTVFSRNRDWRVQGNISRMRSLNVSSFVPRQSVFCPMILPRWMRL